MVAEPIARPATTPVKGSTDANAGALLLHVPLPISVRVIVEPMQTLPGPLIGAGDALTEMIFVA